MTLFDRFGHPFPEPPPTEAEEDTLVHAVAAELQAKIGAPLVLGQGADLDGIVTVQPLAVLGPWQATLLAGLLQLACRHPHIGAAHRALAGEVLETIRDYFVDCPHTLAILRRGDDPAEHVPSRPT